MEKVSRPPNSSLPQMEAGHKAQNSQEHRTNKYRRGILT